MKVFCRALESKLTAGQLKSLTQFHIQLTGRNHKEFGNKLANRVQKKIPSCESRARHTDAEPGQGSSFSLGRGQLLHPGRRDLHAQTGSRSSGQHAVPSRVPRLGHGRVWTAQQQDSVQPVQIVQLAKVRESVSNNKSAPQV